MTTPNDSAALGPDHYATWDEPPDAPITVEQARAVAANWRDTTQLSNALDAMARVAERYAVALREIAAMPIGASQATEIASRCTSESRAA